MVAITGVIPDSPAFRAGVIPGEKLVSINGHAVRDVLDYMFYASEAELSLVTERDGSMRDFFICKGEYDDLGLEFSSYLMDEKRRCQNKCVFCFIDQMPPGMRDSLYFKDDDARLSFLQGNYVTLTNLSQKDVDRIIAMKLNMNVSVHTTNPELRCRMMQNRFAGEKLSYLWQMAEAGIQINCQIVLCPGLNDGAELERTLTDLGKLMPHLTSVAVVPVGLSKYREGLYPLEGFTKETAAQAIDLIARFQKMFLKKFGTRTVFPSDEFFLLAGRELPEETYYEGYPQYENGVGLLRSLETEFDYAVEDEMPRMVSRHVTIATGVSVRGFIRKLVQKAEAAYLGLRCDVQSIRNDFFGESITVTGLLTGQDLISQLRGKDLGEELLLCESMIRKDSDVFLDDLTVADVERELGIPVRLVPNDGYKLLDALLGNA